MQLGVERVLQQLPSLRCCSAHLPPFQAGYVAALPCRPARVDEGNPHPDPIVETASLSKVLPPLATYKHHLKVRGAFKGCLQPSNALNDASLICRSQ